MSTWRTAPVGSVCCPVCHKYQPREKVDDRGHCLDVGRCLKRSGQFLGRAPALPKPKKPFP